MWYNNSTQSNCPISEMCKNVAEEVSSHGKHIYMYIYIVIKLQVTNKN